MEHSTLNIGDLVFPPRKVYLKTFGCQMNVHDSERILSHLERLNFFQTDNKEDADLVLFNTCAIRDLANTKFYSQLGEMKNQKKQNSKLVVGVGGCIAQVEGKQLIQKYRHLDFAFGPDTIEQINDLVYRIYGGESRFAVNTWDRSADYSIETKITHNSPQAFVNIMKGCDKFCSYCIVPFTRGREKSRKLLEVVNDCRRLVEYQGICEITLLGQNVSAFGRENNETLAELIAQLEQITGLKILRYTTGHPKDMTDDLISMHRESKKLARHLHLPVQSGANSVLERMKREYTAEHYLQIIAKMRQARPDIVLSTDIIVGFPNETEEEYQATLKLLDQVEFDSIYSFVFSPRPGTKAAKMEDSLSNEERGKRLRFLQKHQLQIQEKLRKTMEQQHFQILVEGEGEMKGVKKWKGRTSCNRIVHFLSEFPGQDLLWHWVEVKVIASTALSCQGVFVADLGKI